LIGREIPEIRVACRRVLVETTVGVSRAIGRSRSVRTVALIAAAIVVTAIEIVAMANIASGIMFMIRVSCGARSPP